VRFTTGNYTLYSTAQTSSAATYVSLTIHKCKLSLFLALDEEEGGEAAAEGGEEGGDAEAGGGTEGGAAEPEAAEPTAAQRTA